jgi:hypothetical protein
MKLVNNAAIRLTRSGRIVRDRMAGLGPGLLLIKDSYS